MRKILSHRRLANCYSLVFVVSMSFALGVVKSLLEETDKIVVAQFAAYCLAVFAAQLGVAFLYARAFHPRKQTSVKRKGKKEKKIKSAAAFSPTLPFAFFLTFNIFGLALAYTKFLTFAFAAKALLVGVLFLTLWFVLAKSKKVLLGALTLTYAVYILGQAGLIAWTETTRFDLRPDETVAAIFSKYKKVEFAEKPNIYFISFDAMLPESLSARFLDIKQLPYSQTLREKGARIYKNAFVDRIGKKQGGTVIGFSEAALNSLLFLDPVYWSDEIGKFGFFNGILPSPFFEIFKANGYKVHSDNESPLFGVKGPFVDEYLEHWHDRFGSRVSWVKTHCTQALPWWYFQSLGFCSVRGLFLPPPAEAEDVFDIERLHQLRSPFMWKVEQGYPQNIFSLMAKRAADSQPWLYFVYIKAPAHTQANYRGTAQQRRDYRRVYKKTAKQAAGYVSALLTLIDKYDPTGVLVIFGDHGALLSSRFVRRSDFSGEGVYNNGAGNEKFVILDHQAVFAASYPAARCAEYFGSYGEDFVTVSMLARQLISCLSGGGDAVDWEVDYSKTNFRGVSFDDLLYE